MSTSPTSVVPASRRESQLATASALGLVVRPASPDTAVKDPAQTASSLQELLFELGVEPTLTVHEAAATLRWSYWKARRYFSRIDGVCVSSCPKRYKRPYRTFTIPVSIFAREWQKMTGHEPEAMDVIRHRLAVAIRK